MRTLLLPLKDSDIDTRANRRRVCNMIAKEVWRICEAEEAYKNRTPGKLRAGYHYFYARVASDRLFDAYLTLAEAFEPF